MSGGYSTLRDGGYTSCEHPRRTIIPTSSQPTFFHCKCEDCGAEIGIDGKWHGGTLDYARKALAARGREDE